MAPPGVAATLEPVQVSLRLERMGLTDEEAAMLATWVAAHGQLLNVRKLWLFDNRLGDAGAAAVAPLLHSRMLEVRPPAAQAQASGLTRFLGGSLNHQLWKIHASYGILNVGVPGLAVQCYVC